MARGTSPPPLSQGLDPVLLTDGQSVGFLVQNGLELLKVPSSLGLEFWNNCHFNLLKLLLF